MPFRFDSVERWCTAAAPTLGEHNEAVLGSLLGLDVAEIDALGQEEVIGTRPIGVE